MAEVSTEFPKQKNARKILTKAEGRPGKMARCQELREVWRRKYKKSKTLQQQHSKTQSSALTHRHWHAMPGQLV